MKKLGVVALLLVLASCYGCADSQSSRVDVLERQVAHQATEMQQLTKAINELSAASKENSESIKDLAHATAANSRAVDMNSKTTYSVIEDVRRVLRMVEIEANQVHPREQ